MHMIRNVCDHAIEVPQERLERGVAETGNLWMSCELSKTHVVIIIKDDGRGIDPVRLRTKVVEKEIFSQEQAAGLSDQQAIDLVFHPGFSTTEKIDGVSQLGGGQLALVLNASELIESASAKVTDNLQSV